MDFFSGFFSFVVAGGPAMWALVVCSIVTVAIVIERVYFYSTQRSDSRELLRQIGTHIAQNDIPGAIRVCRESKGMLPRILEFGLLRGDKDRSDISEALSIALMENLNLLDRNLPVIGTIAVIAPFVGLFGTVLGIIRAFQDIALKGNSTPAVVAAGVSEALITTAAGLFVAILAVIFFNYFKARIKTISQDYTVAANQLAEMLHFHNTGEPIPTDLYQPVGGTAAATART
ncbi:MAG TPA: MotA/TolQ/ExbB proton channel family protein [Candidatus Binatia bacterium]|nr:MotA/TolQ/ExbB proton channel family protein [Candidatus Binatia bacterium]